MNGVRIRSKESRCSGKCGRFISCYLLILNPKVYDRLNLWEIHIHYLSPNREFDHWLDLHGGMLPSPQMRWCTVMMKIKPLEQFTRRMKRLATLAFGQMKTEESFKKTIVYIFNGSLNILTTSLKL